MPRNVEKGPKPESKPEKGKEKAEFSKEDWELVGETESSDFGTIFWDGVGGKSHDEIMDVYKKGEQVFGEQEFEKMCRERGWEILREKMNEKLKTKEGRNELANALGLMRRTERIKVKGGLVVEPAELKKIEELAKTDKGKQELTEAMFALDSVIRTLKRERRFEKGELPKGPSWKEKEYKVFEERQERKKQESDEVHKDLEQAYKEGEKE